jgi:phage terminase large subunit-like protein
VDELHEHPTAMVVDKMRAGTKRRRNALIFEITNSGFDRTSVCWAHHELSVKVVEGLVENDAWFAYVCGLDPCKACHDAGKQFPSCDKCDDWRNEKVWPKVNPGLGKVLPVAYLREQVEEANGMPSKENIVKRLNFCIWTESEERWLDMTAWDACSAAPLKLEDYRGQDCMAGLDASSTNDLFAFAMDFGPDENGFHDVVMRFWIPEETLTSKESQRSEHDRLLLRQWVDEGWIKATPGGVVDYDMVEADVLADLAKVKLKRLSFDRWGVTQLVTHLTDALRAERVVAFAQTMAGMTAPAKELERIVREGKLRHGGNPVLRWMASNVALQYGPNEQIKPDRKRSGEKIDGIVALIEALDGTMRQPEVKPSVYDERMARGEPLVTRI